MSHSSSNAPTVSRDGNCPDCHLASKMLNVGRDHYGVCDQHKVFWHIGSDVYSEWRQESESVWQRNDATLRSYTQVAPWKAPANVFGEHTTDVFSQPAA